MRNSYFLTLFTAILALTTSFFFEAGATEFKNQKQSTTSWNHLPIESFLSFRIWKEDSDMQDKIHEWEKINRERNHKEIVGRIFQCVGSCRVDRGDGFFNGSPRTGILEGDEIQTIGDSYAWIFLFDGTMVRLSPQTSITFNELNVGANENFINARVNAGNVLWLSRQTNIFQENNLRETDVIFFPYALYEALPVTDKKAYVEDDLYELISEKKTAVNQYKTLNATLVENNKMTGDKPTYAFIVLPNATLMGQSLNVEVVSLLGGRSYFKKRSFDNLGLEKKEEIGNDLLLQMRGFDNKTLTPIQDDLWIEVDEKGRNYSEVSDKHWLDMGEFITKRIPSIMLGRELFLKEFSAFAFRKTYDPLALAKNDGYLLWEKTNLDLRLEFLKEYFRRVETSNLLTSSRFRERMVERGDKKAAAMEYGTHFFITALNRYYQFGEKYNQNSNDKETGEVLNSTKKLLWKKMHGIR
jgi:hypothetical protein